MPWDLRSVLCAGLIGAGIGCCFLFGIAGSAHAYTGEEPPRSAKVDVPTARRIALKSRSGTIADQELEKESGGSGLRYSFDIKDGFTTYEIGVDAQTGVVLENKIEGKNPDCRMPPHTLQIVGRPQ